MTHITLDQVTKPILTTIECAHYLNRKPQTLRAWACLKSGPINPVHIFGRLGWRTEEVKQLLANGSPVAQAEASKVDANGRGNG